MEAFELLPDEIPEEVKKRRNNELLDQQNAISEEDNAEFIGREVEVLIEGRSKSEIKKNPEETNAEKVQLTGRSRCDRIVVFDGNPRLTGSMTKVVINECTPTTLLGSIVTQAVQHGSEGLLPILS